ncbi:MAG: ferrous iron transport protein A [Candidatus Hydrogenedentes bacterium]|nr:ferrous iron transport protein A [Candidatus Hydrogenedentota bacterium]
MTLSSLKPGEKARVVKVRRSGAVHKRIADMGVTPGTVVEVRRIAPLGDPIEVKLRGYNLSLRKDEINAIEVEHT